MVCLIVFACMVGIMGRTVRSLVVLTAVIGAAAHYGVCAEPASNAKHWAYVAPCAAPLPNVKNAVWPENAIDRFILARLEQDRIAPSPRADRERLIRRVSLDLIGLPPSLWEVDAFLA